MDPRSKFRLSMLISALATTAVFAGTYAALDLPTSSTPMADNNMMVTTGNEVVVPAPQENATSSEAHPLAEPAIEPARAVEPGPAAAPVAPAAPPQPGITITEQRLTMDESIQREVMDVLARNDSLSSGKIGVESKDRVVTLSGYLMTSGQVMRAGRDARNVVNVRYVVNEIRPRVGVVTY
jgi:hypothetical protein